MACLRLHIVSGDRSPTLNLETPADRERPALCGVSQVQARVASAPFLLVQIFKKFPEMRRETVSRYWMSWIQLPPPLLHPRSHSCLNTGKGIWNVPCREHWAPPFQLCQLLTVSKDPQGSDGRREGRGRGREGDSPATGSDYVLPSALSGA